MRYLLSFLPANNLEDPPHFEPTDDPDRRCEDIVGLIPDAPNKPYDMKKVDRGGRRRRRLLRGAQLWAMNIVCGFARIDGHVVGIVGNQPQVLAGTLDIEASEKAARFVRTCDAFNIPLVTFVDVPGFLPGTDQEYGGHHPPRRQAALRLLRGDRRRACRSSPARRTAAPTSS